LFYIGFALVLALSVGEGGRTAKVLTGVAQAEVL
jgi:hypothetical protein